MITTLQLRGASLRIGLRFASDRLPLSPKGYEKVMSWLRRWRGASEPADEERALENWVRLRFQLAGSDPMIAIIGAVGRLTDAGMTTADATDSVLRILHEGESSGR